MSTDPEPLESQGSTPLDADESEQLIPDHIRTRNELNEWEQANIAAAAAWIARRRRSAERILSSAFVREVHRRMFAGTWKWAGAFRRSDKNIGVHWPTIASQLEELLANTKHQLAEQAYAPDEIAARFHHRLVQIHAFPNGNGRHARIMTDELLRALDRPRFSWGSRLLHVTGGARTIYIDALRAADEGDFGPLVRFIRS